MPVCKNNPKRKYTGDEPSPKGLGWCASVEKVGKVRKGNDGNSWIVQETSTGIKRWVKKKSSDKIRDESYQGYKKYYTHSNYERPYLVYVKKDVHVFAKNKENYTKVKKYSPKKVFIGKSPTIKFTKKSGSIGKKFDGNSILLKLIKNKYVIIQDSIKEFTTPDNDEIIKFVSPVGPGDIPYPLAFGKKYVYSFVDGVSFISNKDFFGDAKKINYMDRYFELWPFFITKKNQKLLLTLDEYNEIMKYPLKDISTKELKDIAKMFNVTTSGTKKEIAKRLSNLRGIKFIV